MNKNTPKVPGRYVEFEGRDGTLKYAPLTQAMYDRRCAIAKALGYVLPEKCTMSRVSRDNGRRHECWERGEHEHNGVKVASEHQIFVSDLSRDGAPKGTVAYWWPEDAEKAAYAIDKRKPMKDDPKDATAEQPMTQAELL
jgi:hypothetical protein